MMILSRLECIHLCKSFDGVFEDYPFGDEWTVMRHRTNRKSFALIFWRDDTVWMNLKVEPEHVDAYQNEYSSIVPAYHMNKKHWISVILDGSMPDDALRAIVGESYRLTAPKERHVE